MGHCERFSCPASLGVRELCHQGCFSFDRLHGTCHGNHCSLLSMCGAWSLCLAISIVYCLQSTKLRKATPPRTPRSMFLDFLRPGVRSGFECLSGRRHARPSVPTIGTKTPQTLSGGCGGSGAFLLVLIVVVDLVYTLSILRNCMDIQWFLRNGVAILRFLSETIMNYR